MKTDKRTGLVAPSISEADYHFAVLVQRCMKSRKLRSGVARPAYLNMSAALEGSLVCQGWGDVGNDDPRNRTAQAS
jgi:hypothetical protein